MSAAGHSVRDKRTTDLPAATIRDALDLETAVLDLDAYRAGGARFPQATIVDMFLDEA